MGIFDFLTGEFIDVIHWVDDTRDTMVWRFEREGHEIKYGAKLTVREGQAAVFVHEGQLADVFTPGLYMLETNNMPIMTTLQHWDHGFKSPFKSEIYYVNTTRFNDLKWGTKNPIMARDPEFGPVRLRAFGTYSVRVVDPARFLTEIVGTDGEFTMDEISFQIRNIIVQEFSRVIAGSGIPVLDMAANTGDLGKLIAAEISGTVAEYGLSIPELYIENISLPPAVEQAMDKRTSMGSVGGQGPRAAPGRPRGGRLRARGHPHRPGHAGGVARHGAFRGRGHDRRRPDTKFRHGRWHGHGYGHGDGAEDGQSGTMGRGASACSGPGRRGTSTPTAAAGRTCLAHRGKRPDQRPVLQGQDGPHGG